MTFDPDLLDGLLDIDGPGRLAVRRAIGRAPLVRLETFGASTLTVVCDDVDHQIPGQASGLTAATGDRTWALGAIKRNGGRTVLVFQDSVADALRYPEVLSVPAGSTTVNELATRLTLRRGVDVLLEPTRQTITRAFTLDDTVWAGLGNLAQQSGRWRYSDGHQLVLASPAWLLAQPVVATIVEDQGGYTQLEYDLHSNKPIAVAAADHTGPTPAVGTVHELDVAGPAAGAWLVGSYSTKLGEDLGRTTWVRPSAWPRD